MRKYGIFSKLNMSILNHGLKSALHTICVTVLVAVPIIFTISTPASALVGSSCLRDTQCASDEYCDLKTGTCQRDSGASACIMCTSDMDCALGQTCDLLTNCCSSGLIKPDLCDCASVGYGGFCSGTDYSTCYNSCTRACTQSGCPNGYSCTYNSSSTSGKQYYGGSCDAAASTCSIASQTCTTACTSVANRETRSGSESCTRSCSISNGTCSYSGSTRTYTDTCASNYTSGGCKSAGASCSGCNSWSRTSTGTCSGGTISITCNKGHYLSSGTCKQCEAGYYCPGDNSRYGCSAGYTSAAGASSCSPITVNCPAGQFMWWWGGYTYCEDCHPGYYCPGGTNVYGSGGVGSANSAGIVPIYSCPSGYTANTTYGKSAASQCQIAVAAGKYLTSQNGTSTAACASGTYRGAHNVNYGSTDSCTSCPSPSVSGSIYVYFHGGSALSPTGATAATQCYLDTNVADYWTHNVEYRGFYRCSGKQYYSTSTGYYSNCESKKRFSECNAGYFIDNSVAMNSEFSNSCTICGAGTYTEKYSTASNIGDGSYHYQTSCTACPGGTYNPNTGSTSSSACVSCPNNYKNGGTGTTSQSACVGAFTKTGSQLDPAMQTGCSTRTLTACTPGTCTYYKNYAGTITSDCTPTNCIKSQCCTSVAANYYITTSDNCTATPCSNYPDYPLSDGGNITSAYCYKNVTLTGQQLEPTMMTGCNTRTLSACTPGTCTYKDYRTATDSVCTPTNCTKGQCCTSASANYYISSTDNCTAKSCSANYANYPYSDGGNIGNGYCYKNVTLTGQQLEPTMMTGCNTRTLSACTPGTCTYRDYKGATDGSCTPTNCTKGQCCTSASANYYISSTDNCTAKSCSANYPYSDGGNITSAYCYASKTNTGSQLSCSQPENSESYTCGTCTPGTCDWRDYKSATDTSCTPGNCTQPVNPGSVVCNTGYYRSEVSCLACTNKPSNSSYTGTASSNSCPWSCNSGYNLTSDNQCGQFCGSGITHIHLSTGLKIPLYATARTAPAINVKWNDTVCYGSLATGSGSGLNVNYNGTTYHAVE